MEFPANFTVSSAFPENLPFLESWEEFSEPQKHCRYPVARNDEHYCKYNEQYAENDTVGEAFVENGRAYDYGGYRLQSAENCGRCRSDVMCGRCRACKGYGCRKCGEGYQVEPVVPFFYGRDSGSESRQAEKQHRTCHKAVKCQFDGGHLAEYPGLVHSDNIHCIEQGGSRDYQYSGNVQGRPVIAFVQESYPYQGQNDGFSLKNTAIITATKTG